MSKPEIAEYDKDAMALGPAQSADLEHAETHGTYLDQNEAVHLSEEHRNYLLECHGTVELDPLPTMSAADPYNWPTWKVCTPCRSPLLLGVDQSANQGA